MHSDELLSYVLDQMVTDAHNGEVEPIFDLLDLIPREVLLSYLCPRLAQQALDAGWHGQKTYNELRRLSVT